MQENEYKALVELQTAYHLASWQLDKKLVSLALLLQNETEVSPAAYKDCTKKTQGLREVLDLAEAWLAEHTPKEVEPKQ